MYYRYYHDPGDHNTRAHYGVRTTTHKLIYFWKKDQWELLAHIRRTVMFTPSSATRTVNRGGGGAALRVARDLEAHALVADVDEMRRHAPHDRVEPYRLPHRSPLGVALEHRHVGHADERGPARPGRVRYIASRFTASASAAGSAGPMTTGRLGVAHPLAAHRLKSSAEREIEVGHQQRERALVPFPQARHGRRPDRFEPFGVSQSATAVHSRVCGVATTMRGREGIPLQKAAGVPARN